MKALTVDVRESAGRILCCTIFRPGGKKLLAKGHTLSEEDVRLLETEGMEQVWVTELEDGEINEDEAVMQVAIRIAGGSVDIRPAAGGRVNLHVTEDCCLTVDEELLRQINCTSSVVIATLPNHRFVAAGEKIASVKSTPFAVAASELEAVVNILAERGAILNARPIRTPTVALLYTDPVQGDRAKNLFDSVMRTRLEKYHTTATYTLTTLEEETVVARALQHLLRAKPTVILVASTTAPAGPDDVIGRAMARVGCHFERFLAPVEPGSLMLLGYKDDVPILSAPGCYRSNKANVIDLLLPPILSKYRISATEIACMGHGGLLG